MRNIQFALVIWLAFAPQAFAQAKALTKINQICTEPVSDEQFTEAFQNAISPYLRTTQRELGQPGPKSSETRKSITRALFGCNPDPEFSEEHLPPTQR